MEVLVVYAHLNPKSFCHAVMESFAKGLEDGGHINKLT
jgi:NAD(P)H dehydrogenase (quinone)